MGKTEHDFSEEAMIENIADFIYSFDHLGRLTYANTPFLKLLKKSPGEIYGQTLKDLKLPVEFTEKHEKSIEKVVREKKPQMDRQLFITESGTRYYEYLFAPIMDEAGRLQGVIATPRDITHSYFLNSKIEEQSLRAEGRVCEIGKLSDRLRTLKLQAMQDLKAPIINLESLIKLVEEDLNEEYRKKICLTLEMIRQSIHRIKTATSSILCTRGVLNE